MAREPRQAVTTWRNWSDIIESARVIDHLIGSPKYRSHAVHTWEPSLEMRRSRWAQYSMTLSSGMGLEILAPSGGHVRRYLETEIAREWARRVREAIEAGEVVS